MQAVTSDLCSELAQLAITALYDGDANAARLIAAAFIQGEQQLGGCLWLLAPVARHGGSAHSGPWQSSAPRCHVFASPPQLVLAGGTCAKAIADGVTANVAQLGCAKLVHAMGAAYQLAVDAGEEGRSLRASKLDARRAACLRRN